MQLDGVYRSVLVPCLVTTKTDYDADVNIFISLFTCCLHAGRWTRAFSLCCSGCPECRHGVVWGNTEPIWTAASGNKPHLLGNEEKTARLKSSKGTKGLERAVEDLPSSRVRLSDKELRSEGLASSKRSIIKCKSVFLRRSHVRQTQAL